MEPSVVYRVRIRHNVVTSIAGVPSAAAGAAATIGWTLAQAVSDSAATKLGRRS